VPQKPAPFRLTPKVPPVERRPGSTERLYTYAWQKASKAFLRLHRFCECDECRAAKSSNPLFVPPLATVVDHTIPHRGDRALFWNRNNWRPMAESHHDRKTVKHDGGFGRPSTPKRT
jgi:5-methylcytosine-specific restriction protein A